MIYPAGASDRELGDADDGDDDDPGDELTPAEEAALQVQLLLMSSHLAEAATAAREGLREFPESANLHGLLAQALLGLERPDEAEAAAGAAVARDPELDVAHAMLGLARMAQGQHCAAERAFLDALTLDPEDPLYYVWYGQLMRRTGHLEKAEKLARAALALSPDLGRAEQLLAVIASETGRGDARAHAARSLALADDDPAAHVTLGQACLMRGQPFKARAHFHEALRRDPDPDYEEIYRVADRCCRWIYLPMYYFALVIDRLPGKQLTVWVVIIGLVMALDAGGPATDAYTPYLIGGYLIFCLYSWTVDWLVTQWIKLVPPRLPDGYTDD